MSLAWGAAVHLPFRPLGPTALLLLSPLALTGCLTEESLESGHVDLSRAACETRLAAAHDACATECASDDAQAAAHAACARAEDTELAVVASGLVGAVAAARASVVIPVEVCLGRLVTSSCTDDRVAARKLVAAAVDASTADSVFDSAAGVECSLAKALRQAQCVQEQGTYLQLAATSTDPETRRLAQPAYMLSSSYPARLRDWAGDRLACELPDQGCLEGCDTGFSDRLSCRWECPVKLGTGCVPDGYPGDAACGVVDRSLAWDAAFACECSADTAACRAR